MTESVPNGFKVTLSETGELPKESDNEVTVRVAYDVFRGAPRHSGADFDLDRDVMTSKRDIKGGKIKTVSIDEIVAEITDRSKFELTQKGFDPNRDIIIYEGWRS